jgi:transcriptional regulator with XRE-family HTH domain
MCRLDRYTQERTKSSLKSTKGVKRMPKEAEPVAVLTVITENMRRIRTERGLLQEDIAMAARWVGLMWSSVTVTQIESGSRQLNLDEVILLPLVLRCSLKDLLGTEKDNDPIQLGYNTVLEASTVRQLVAEKGPKLSAAEIPMLPGLEPALDPKIVEVVRHACLEGTLLSYLLVREGARGEAERKAAQTLKISAPLVTAYALRLWGRSLTEERDGRAVEHIVKGKELRAVRGHITRALLREIANNHHFRETEPEHFSLVKLEPANKDEMLLRAIKMDHYKQNEKLREQARRPYERWMRAKVLEVFEKERTVR